MIGSLSVVGLGPGDSNLITPEVSLAMVEASAPTPYKSLAL